MAIKTKCQTPGAVFHTSIEDEKIKLAIDLNKDLKLSESEAKLLESNIHNAMELVLAKYFVDNESGDDKLD